MILSAACFAAKAEERPPPRLILPAEASSSAVRVEQEDYAFKLSAPSVSSGSVDFVVRNNGHEDHEFVIVHLQGEHYDLPIGEIEAFAPGETRAIRADLHQGTYALVCLMVSVKDGEPQSHMALGMQVTIKVTE